MICPLNANKYSTRPQCYSSCALYSNGCLIRQALKAYVTLNTPIAYDFENDLKLKSRSDEWAGQMSISSQWGDR